MNHKLRPPLWMAVLTVILAGCNLPGQAPKIAATATHSPTSPPTLTSSPVPPSATPLPPTATPVILTPTPFPTLTSFPSPTPTPPAVKTPSIVPAAGLFVGEFSGGRFSFRVNDKGTYVTLKEVLLSKAECSNRKKASDHLVFDPVYFLIDNSRFNIYLDRATISGVFSTSKSAYGTITVTFSTDKAVCSIGPVSWKASLQ